MERYQLMIDDRGKLDRNVVSAGMWLRVGTAAAFVVAGGLVSVFNGDMALIQSVGIALAGAALCAFAWRRAWMALDAGDAERTGVLRLGEQTS